MALDPAGTICCVKLCGPEDRRKRSSCLAHGMRITAWFSVGTKSSGFAPHLQGMEDNFSCSCQFYHAFGYRGDSIWLGLGIAVQSCQPGHRSPISTLPLKLKHSLNFHLNRKASRFLDRTDSVATNLLLQFKKQTSVWHVPRSSIGHQWHHT